MADRHSKHVIDPALMSLWLDRYRELGSRLKAQPDGEWSWLWRVRRDILYYLLHRYGRDVTLHELAACPPETQDKTAHPTEPVSAYLHQPTGAKVERGSTYPPRERSDFRARLDHLRAVNDRVREEYPPTADRFAGVDPQARIIRRTYPEGTYGEKEYLLDLEQRLAVESALESIRGLLIRNGHADAADTPITDEQILAILNLEGDNLGPSEAKTPDPEA